MSAFSWTSAAQTPDCGCPRLTKEEIKEEEIKEGERPPVHRQKPRAEYEPRARSIAPRDLPAVYEPQARRARKAAEVIEEFTPKSWIRDAKAIAVFPNVTKAAFIWGARWGHGLISKRDEEGEWIPPSYVHITGINWGLQAGVQSTDLVLIFTNDDAVDALLRGKLTLNADASATAGPVGRKAQVGVPILMNSGIYAFSKTKGLYAGVSLDGATITINDKANHNVYGRYISGDEILQDRRVEPNNVVAPFLNALDTYTAPACDFITAKKNKTTPKADATAENKTTPDAEVEE